MSFSQARRRYFSRPDAIMSPSDSLSSTTSMITRVVGGGERFQEFLLLRRRPRPPGGIIYPPAEPGGLGVRVDRSFYASALGRLAVPALRHFHRR